LVSNIDFSNIFSAISIKIRWTIAQEFNLDSIIITTTMTEVRSNVPEQLRANLKRQDYARYITMRPLGQRINEANAQNGSGNVGPGCYTACDGQMRGGALKHHSHFGTGFASGPHPETRGGSLHAHHRRHHGGVLEGAGHRRHVHHRRHHGGVLEGASLEGGRHHRRHRGAGGEAPKPAGGWGARIRKLLDFASKGCGVVKSITENPLYKATGSGYAGGRHRVHRHHAHRGHGYSQGKGYAGGVAWNPRHRFSMDGMDGMGYAGGAKPKARRAPSAWNRHVASVRKAHPELLFGAAVKMASASYRK
jgi:hypothetical protein